MLPRWLNLLLDDGSRGRLARRVEAPIAAIFTLVRNAGFVAIAQYVAAAGNHVGFDLLHGALAGLLVVQIASVFMLGPQIRLVRDPTSDRARLVQGGLNMALCAAACGLALYGIDLFVEGVIAWQTGGADAALDRPA